MIDFTITADRCPKLEAPSECGPPDTRDHKCDTDSDCDGTNTVCCSDTCTRTCVQGLSHSITAAPFLYCTLHLLPTLTYTHNHPFASFSSL